MKCKKLGALILGSLFWGFSPMVSADSMGDSLSEIDIGMQEFANNCVVCHGSSGKGDGPYAGMLQEPVADLTVLQKNNNGVFPFKKIVETIDGRVDVKAHGMRDMPIWGNEYNRVAAKYYTDYYGERNVENFIKARILALASYIYGLQEK